MRKISYCAIGLVMATICNPAFSQQSDALSQLKGIWAVEWTAHGNTQVARVVFTSNPAAHEKVLASLPFLPGQATITHCDGQGCAGADLDVGGIDFEGNSYDCLYAHLITGEKTFKWSSRGGTNTRYCLPNVDFTKDPDLK